MTLPATLLHSEPTGGIFVPSFGCWTGTGGWEVHQLYVTVIYCAKYDIGPVAWKDYLKKHGRKRFQIDMARELMNYAISKSWTNLNGAKPDWMRRATLHPCDCNKCFFCLLSLTTGIDHKRKRHNITTFIQHDRTRTKPVDCTDKRSDTGRGQVQRNRS